MAWKLVNIWQNLTGATNTTLKPAFLFNSFIVLPICRYYFCRLSRSFKTDSLITRFVDAKFAGFHFTVL